MGPAFRDATRVVPLGAATFAAHLDEGYAIAGAPNGGYLLAVMAEAAVRHVDPDGAHQLRCLAASAAYSRAADAGDAVIEVLVDRAGTRVTQATAVLRQAGRVRVRALLSVGRLREDPAPRYAGPMPPAIGARESCRRATTGHDATRHVSILDRFELLVDRDEHGAPEVRAWARLEEGQRFDDRSLLFLLDALPPASVSLGSIGWVPTIQLATSVRSMPRSDWLVACQRARSVADGLLEQSCEVFDELGTLVAVGSQLAMVRFARGAHTTGPGGTAAG